MMHQEVTASALFSVEAEQQLLGAILNDNTLFDQISSMLRPDHFYDPVHARIYKLAAARIAKDHLVSPVQMKSDFAEDEGAQQLGGPTYFIKLSGAAVSSFAIRDYADMIVKLHDRRTMAGRLKQLSEEVEKGGDAGKAASELELYLHEREEHSDEPRTMSFLKAQTLSLQRMIDIKNGEQVKVPSGLQALDEILKLNPKQYTILGGSTSMGKTALALSITLAAARAGFGVGFVTLEMPEEDLANRINSVISQIPYNTYTDPMSENQFRKVVEAAKELEALPLEIFSERVRDVPAILSEGKKLKRKMKPNGPFKGFKLLVIDYIQLVRAKGESQHVRLAEVANALKQVAKQLDVHVIALAQVDRSLGKEENYQNARPRLADLRGSGDLENAPDNVVFVFRPEYYLTPPRCIPPKDPDQRADWEADYDHWKGKAEIIVAKARMGKIDSVTVECDMTTNVFRDVPDRQMDAGF
ncbi:DnaB-like helicase C-terminal domain-containing protein [Ruegeria lacuscaerulensis]|uniref:DnaB-like helicase C-terminal domain-containing protein n=1 Tax=Ruegeria lacuscaerulensis TaxID=55218 RepID=UPI00147EF948|nr:DnaB-like helicase C-terminal domain-containing protein [Ruegeria lacuscaerulensis]